MAQVDELTRETGYSRSRLFVLAMESFVERYKNQKIQDTLNEVYGESLSDLESEFIDRRRHRRYHRRMIEGTW